MAAFVGRFTMRGSDFGGSNIVGWQCKLWPNAGHQRAGESPALDRYSPQPTALSIQRGPVRQFNYVRGFL